MKIGLHLIAALLCAGTVLPASSEPHETFAERPGRRQELVLQAREKALRQREAAQAWARQQGIPSRIDNGVQVMELMAIRDGVHIWYSTENYNAAITTAANAVRNTAPFNVDGSGVIVGIWDEGSVMTTHQELVGRVNNMNDVAHHYHTTHIGGTIGASGVKLGRQGMAPACQIDSYDWEFDFSEMNARSAASPGEPGAIFLSNHSYGMICGWVEISWSGHDGWHWPYWRSWGAEAADPAFGQYSEDSQDYDQAVYNAPYYLPFVAVGNDRNDGPAPGETMYYSENLGASWITAPYDPALHPATERDYKGGYDTIKPEGVAKNVITVGAVQDAVTGVERDLSKAEMINFSNWGPADDGRIKPDIVANGWEVWSCDNDSTNDYIVLSGTSMAAPNACGSAALLIDYYDDLFPGGAMRASTLKGLIIHTADDLGNPGPDYAYGWGLMNTLAAAELITSAANGNTNRMVENYISAVHDSRTIEISSNGQAPIRVTLCWTDPASSLTGNYTDSRTPRLVNDLDLKLIGPDGDHYPYSLSYANPSNNATADAKNEVDNVEQVYIEAPATGTYQIVVDIDGSLTGGTQWYSLLVDNGMADRDADGLPDYWEMAYFSNPTGALATADVDGDGQDNLSEFISGHDPTLASSRLAPTQLTVPSVGMESPFIIQWDPVVGRVYRISWSDYLPGTYTDLSGDLPYPANSYTDAVNRTGPYQYYKLEVRLGP